MGPLFWILLSFPIYLLVNGKLYSYIELMYDKKETEK